jgi:hypothetical protein
MNLKLLVNTTFNYSEFTLPVLFKSLEEASFDLNDVIVISGGHQNHEILSPNFHNVPYNSSDFTAFIAVIEEGFDADYFFYMHDTCHVGPRFKSLLMSTQPGELDVISLTRNPSMNIGLYSAKYLRDKTSSIKMLKNSDYGIEAMQQVKTWGVHNEDYLSWGQNTAHKSSYSQLLNCPRSGNPILISENDYYKNGVIRRLEYYEFLDFYKVKANWRLRDFYEMNP